MCRRVSSFETAVFVVLEISNYLFKFGFRSCVLRYVRKKLRIFPLRPENQDVSIVCVHDKEKSLGVNSYAIKYNTSTNPNYFPASLVNGSFFRAEVNLSKSRIRSITSCHASCLWLICITLGHHKHCWWCCPLVRFLHSPMCLLCMSFFGSIHINYLCETVGKCGMFIVKEPFCLLCLRYYHVIIAWKSGKCTWKMQCFSILIIDAVWE